MTMDYTVIIVVMAKINLWACTNGEAGSFIIIGSSFLSISSVSTTNFRSWFVSSEKKSKTVETEIRKN